MRSMGRVRGSGRNCGVSSNNAAVASPPHPNLSPPFDKLRGRGDSGAAIAP
jgi:hypothetical protein